MLQKKGSWADRLMVCHGTGDSPLKCASDTLRKSEKVITQVPTPPQPRFLSHNRDTIKKENYTTEYNFNTNAFFPRSRFCTHRCKSHKYSFAFCIPFTTSSATSYRTPSYSHTKITILLAGNIKRRNLETHSPQYRGKSNQANSAFYDYRMNGWSSCYQLWHCTRKAFCRLSIHNFQFIRGFQEFTSNLHVRDVYSVLRISATWVYWYTALKG